MIGVIVWSSAEREKAVIWCEDQGALAYLQGQQNLVSEDRVWPEAGDLVELETEEIGTLRHARAVSLISENRCPQLPNILREEAARNEPKLRVVARQDSAPMAPAAAQAENKIAIFRPRARAAR